MTERTSHLVAVAFAFAAFALAILVGLAAGVAPGTILIRSIVVLVLAYATGSVIGRVAAVALNEHLTDRKSRVLGSGNVAPAGVERVEGS